MESTRLQNRMPRAVTVSAIFALGAVAAIGLRGNAGQPVSTPPPVQPSAQVLDIQNAFEKVADKLRPSVVSIRSRQTTRGVSLQQPGMGDSQDPFQFFFGGPGGQGGNRQFRSMPQAPRRAYASGSGVIVNSDGWILTNDHVVADADKVTVTLDDGREFVGQVKRDFRSDLALVKIDARDLPAAEMADSDRAHVGQWAIAFGSPFGLNDTMTVGIVSSLHRQQTISEAGQTRFYSSLLQTDASINPGNSGGPLVDIYGRVVGINVAIESPSGGNVGVGFAIPANTARYIMSQLMTKGTVTRGYLGLAPTQLSYTDQQRFGVKQGALVSSVQDGTPASKAGFQVEDVIVRYNGQAVPDDVALRDMVSRTKPGESVPVVVRRDGSEHTLNVTVSSAPDLQTAQNNDTATPDDNSPSPGARVGKLGVSVANATDSAARQQLNLKGAGQPGALITEVVPGSPASDAGLQAGDVILKLNGKSVGSASQLNDIVRTLHSGSVQAVVRHGDQTLLVPITID